MTDKRTASIMTTTVTKIYSSSLYKKRITDFVMSTDKMQVAGVTCVLSKRKVINIEQTSKASAVSIATE